MIILINAGELPLRLLPSLFVQLLTHSMASSSMMPWLHLSVYWASHIKAFVDIILMILLLISLHSTGSLNFLKLVLLGRRNVAHRLRVVVDAGIHALIQAGEFSLVSACMMHLWLSINWHGIIMLLESKLLVLLFHLILYLYNF